jgi:hypothetical protein
VAFVRTKRVGKHEYRQLVENYREYGQHRQRVLAHLGQHDTVQDAIAGLRRKLAEREVSRLAVQVQKARRAAAHWESSVRSGHAEQIDRYHDGEIPTPAEVAKRTGEDKTAPIVAEVEVEGYLGTYKKPVYGEVPIPPEVDEYCRAFGDGTAEEHENPDKYGHTLSYPSLSYYRGKIDNLAFWRERAKEKRGEYERQRQRLHERIEKLERVAHSIHRSA